MYLLDTHVVSELRKATSGKADKNVIAWAENIPASTLYISVITALELETGVLLVERRAPLQGLFCEPGLTFMFSRLLPTVLYHWILP